MHLRGPGRSRTCPGALRKPHPFVAGKVLQVHRCVRSPDQRPARAIGLLPMNPYRSTRDARGGRGTPEDLRPQMAAQASRRRRQPAGSRRPALRLHPFAAKPMAQRSHHQRDRAAARRVQATDQNTDRAAIGGHRRHAVLGVARLRPDEHAQG